MTGLAPCEFPTVEFEATEVFRTGPEALFWAWACPDPVTLLFLKELEVERELSDEDEPELELEELLEFEPESDPLESDTDSLERDLLRDGRCWLLLFEAGCTANFDRAVTRAWPLSLLLLVLLQVDMGLAAPLALFRYTLEDLTGSISEARAPDTDEELAEPLLRGPLFPPRGDRGASFQLLELLEEGRPPL